MPKEKNSRAAASAEAAAAAAQAKGSLTTNCLVCGGASAAHTHYGAVCCYSCRAFFRRGIKRSFNCVRGDNKCQVNSITRTNCKRCRYERCLAVGMKPSLVDACLRRKVDMPDQTPQQILIQAPAQEEEQAVRMIDQNGRLVDPNLRFVDQNGQLVNPSGLLIDQNGHIFDQAGQLIEQNGRMGSEENQLIDGQGDHMPEPNMVEIPIGSQSKIDGSLLLQALEGRKKVLLELREDKDGDQSSEQELTQIAEGDGVQIPPGAQPVRQQTYFIFNPLTQNFEPVTIAEFMEQPVAEEVVVAQDQQIQEITSDTKQDQNTDTCIAERASGDEVILSEEGQELGSRRVNGVQFDSRNEDHRIIQEYLRLQQERNFLVPQNSRAEEGPVLESSQEQENPTGASETVEEEAVDMEPEHIYISHQENDVDIEELVDMEFEQELMRRKMEDKRKPTQVVQPLPRDLNNPIHANMDQNEIETIVPDRVEDIRKDDSLKPSLYRKAVPDLVSSKGNHSQSPKPVLQNRFGMQPTGLRTSEITLQKSAERSDRSGLAVNFTPTGRGNGTPRVVTTPFYLPKRSPAQTQQLRSPGVLRSPVVPGVYKLRTESNNSTPVSNSRVMTSASKSNVINVSPAHSQSLSRAIDAIADQMKQNSKAMENSPASLNRLLDTPPTSTPHIAHSFTPTASQTTPLKVSVIVSQPRHQVPVNSAIQSSRLVDNFSSERIDNDLSSVRMEDNPRTPTGKRKQRTAGSPVPPKKRKTSDFQISNVNPGKFKVPYLNFTVEEEFLMHQLSEGYDMFINLIQKSLVNMEPDLMIWVYRSAMHPCTTLSEEKMGPLMDSYKKTFAHHASCLIPDGLGKLSNGFLSNLYDYSQGALNALDLSCWFAYSDSPSMYEQEISDWQRCSQYMRNWFLENIPEMVLAPAVSYNNCGWFADAWCEKPEEEKIFKRTLDEVGQVLKGDDKLRATVNLLVTISQTEESPFFKSKNIRRLFKSIYTLLWRYLEHTGHKNVSEVANTITGFIPKLHRAGDIFERRILYNGN